ncbi:hypothetical protein M9458_020952 [Cirrhinus mrigala]|uniref:Uncharacterized protein n=1 Tax=Cirrhinus mrigala TaxID=683832 RepID=A0ABD0QGQ2_CIRMR
MHALRAQYNGCIITDDHASPPSPRIMEHEPEPTTTNKPSPSGATELRITPKPEPIMSEQVRETATLHATEEFTVEREEAEEGPSHCTSAEGELSMELGQIDLIDFYTDIYADMPPILPPSSDHQSILNPLSALT